MDRHKDQFARIIKCERLSWNRALKFILIKVCSYTGDKQVYTLKPIIQSVNWNKKL